MDHMVEEIIQVRNHSSNIVLKKLSSSTTLMLLITKTTSLMSLPNNRKHEGVREVT